MEAKSNEEWVACMEIRLDPSDIDVVHTDKSRAL